MRIYKFLTTLFFVITLVDTVCTQITDTIGLNDKILEIISLRKAGSVEMAILKNEKLLDQYKGILEEEYPKGIAILYTELGNNYGYLSDFEKAINSFKKAKYYHLLLGKKSSLNVGIVNRKIGFCYSNMEDYENALTYYDNTLQCFKLNYEHDDQEIGYIINLIGICLFQKEDYKKALSYFYKASSIYNKSFGENHFEVSEIYNNVGSSYAKLSDYETALSYFKKVFSIQQKYSIEDNYETASLYTNMANCYQETGRGRLALDYFDKARTIVEGQLGVMHPFTAELLSNIGNSHLLQGNATEAHAYLDQSLDIWLQIFGEEHTNVAITYFSMGQVYALEKDYNKALEYIDKAIVILNAYKDGQLALNEGSIPVLVLLEILEEKAAIHSKLYRKKKDIEQLELTSSAYKDAIAIFDHVYKGYHSEETQRAIIKDHFFVFDKAIENSYQLYETKQDASALEAAFVLSEKSRSIMLLKAFKDSGAKELAGLSDDLLEQEQQLKTDIAFLDKAIFQELAMGADPNDENMQAMKSQLFDQNTAYTKLIESFEEQYPDYYRLKYNLMPTTAVALRNTLSSEEALVEYFVGEENIFVFIVTAAAFDVVKIKKDFPLKKWVVDMREAISKSTLITNKQIASFYADYTSNAYALYDKLVAPISDILPPQIIIIPSGILGYLPFDALLTSEPTSASEFRTHDYLLKEYQISYCYSATLYQEMLQKENITSNNFCAFAPRFDDSLQVAYNWEQRRKLGALKYNTKEAETIQDIMQGDIFLGEDATKNQFIQSAKDYNILHLATHGQANDEYGEYSFLAFDASAASDENESLLFVKDLYNLQLDADMVVLSACETGIGEYQKGEGIISLARGFSYAGAKSIVTTLWSVSDATSAKLMEAFYQYINNGLPKDEALRQAKLSYVSNSRNVMAHPFFWAAFTPIGAMESVGSASGTFSWYWLGVPLLLFVFFVLRQKKAE